MLGWAFDILFMTEVRCTSEQQVSIARRAAVLGYSICFSPPPPPSPNFRSSPGGTALAARRPIALRSLEPPILDKWRDMGRAVICQAILPSSSFLFLSLYGIPVGHDLKSANDWFLADALSWANTMNMPTMICGDLNENPYSSFVLASLHVWGFTRLNDNSPTTKGRTDRTSKGLPIGSCFGQYEDDGLRSQSSCFL